MTGKENAGDIFHEFVEDEEYVRGLVDVLVAAAYAAVLEILGEDYGPDGEAEDVANQWANRIVQKVVGDPPKNGDGTVIPTHMAYKVAAMAVDAGQGLAARKASADGP